MKKFLSLILAVCILFSMTTVAFAEDKQTTIRYVADGTSSYEVTVPSLMTPGEVKQVTLEGTWTTDEKVVVSAPTSVTLTNDIDGDTEELAVTFSGLSVVGNNRETISLSENIAVASMPEDVIFGTWEGIVTYSVSVVELISFTFDQSNCQAEEGMTWREWFASEYCSVYFSDVEVGYEDGRFIIDGDCTVGDFAISRDGEVVIILGIDDYAVYAPIVVKISVGDSMYELTHIVLADEAILPNDVLQNTYGEDAVYTF